MNHEQVRCFFCAPTESRFKAHDPCSKHVGRELPPGWLGCDLHRYLCPDESCTCWPKEHARDAQGKIARDAFVSASADLGIEHAPTPEWSDLPENTRELYRRIADAVARGAS